MAQTEHTASAVVARAEAHTAAAKGLAQASERQAEALREAMDLLPSVEAAVGQALGAVRYKRCGLGYPFHDRLHCLMFAAVMFFA